MSSSAKPTIVFVPGAWHGPECFELVRAQLSKLGYPSEGINNPTFGAEPPNKVFADDVASLRATLDTLAEEGKEIVVVAHSYGGAVGSCAVEGLNIAHRSKEGKAGGVLMLVYLSALVLFKGQSVQDAGGNGKLDSRIRIEGDYTHSWNERDFFYHDVSPELQDAAIANISHHCKGAFSSPITYEPWHDMPCMYFFCENDVALVLAAQEMLAARLGENATTFRCASSHSPFLSMPEKVVEGIELAVKAGTEKTRAQLLHSE